MKVVGFFGGSFDPIHIGHLSLAVDFLEKGEVEEVWFSPALVSPFKAEQEPVSFEHRLKMLELATENHPRLKTISIERELPKPSYTYATLTTLAGQHPDCQFKFFLGQDGLKGLEKWFEIEKLLKEFPLLIGVRPPFLTRDYQVASHLAPFLEGAFYPTRPMQISSTELRERLRTRAFCEHLVPKKVLDYIALESLYL